MRDLQGSPVNAVGLGGPDRFRTHVGRDGSP